MGCDLHGAQQQVRLSLRAFPTHIRRPIIAADGICGNFVAEASCRAAVALLAAVALPLE